MYGHELDDQHRRLLLRTHLRPAWWHLSVVHTAPQITLGKKIHKETKTNCFHDSSINQCFFALFCSQLQSVCTIHHKTVLTKSAAVFSFRLTTRSNPFNVQNLKMTFLFFTLLTVCALKSADSQHKKLYQSLLTWKDTIFKEKSTQTCTYQLDEKEFYKDRITFEETESLSKIGKCRHDSTNCTRWQFFKDAKVIVYDESDTKAFVIIQIDVEHFLYIKRSENTFLPSHTIKIGSSGAFKTINVKLQESETSQQIHLHKMSSEMLKEPWYRSTQLALKDKRVEKYLERERKMADRKFLELPFIQHFSLTNGIFG